MAPGDLLVVTAVFGFCAACATSGGETDTLLVYADASAEPLAVEVLNVVASEVPPEAATVRLVAAPNPVRGVSTVTLTRAQAGPARVAVHDLLGREVAVLHDGPAAEVLRLRVDASARLVVVR